MDLITQSLRSIFETKLIEEIQEVGKIKSFSVEEVVINYGDTIRFFPIVISGTLKVFKRDENNNEILLYYLGSAESCAMAYACCMEAKNSEVRVVAEENGELIAIPNNKLDEWLLKYASWKSYIFSSFTLRFNELLRSIESIAFHKLDERLVNYLKNKAKVVGKNSIQLSHQQIAEELGTNRVVISRLLKQLENDKKLILYRNEIKLLQSFND